MGQCHGAFCMGQIGHRVLHPTGEKSMSDGRPLNNLSQSAGDNFQADSGNRNLIRRLYQALQNSNQATAQAQLIQEARIATGDINNDATPTR
jgi:hypothetical protein